MRGATKPNGGRPAERRWSVMREKMPAMVGLDSLVPGWSAVVPLGKERRRQGVTVGTEKTRSDGG